MRLEPDGTLVLSRRNLTSLLAKLDGHPPDSACTIIGGSDAPNVVVRAEEDDVHYSRRQAGAMHILTEAHATRPPTGVEREPYPGLFVVRTKRRG